MTEKELHPLVYVILLPPAIGLGIIFLGFKKILCLLFGHIYESDDILIGNTSKCLICDSNIIFEKELWYRGQHFKGAIPQRQRCTSK